MPLAEILPGDKVIVRSADHRHLERRATSGIVRGYDFLVVWACREEEWAAARAEGRKPDAIPWPAETVNTA